MGQSQGTARACIKLIAQGDEDLFLSLRYALPADRPRLAALFAFQVELRRIPARVSEPPLGEMRLQWWREALDEIAAGGPVRGHPVVEAIARSAPFDGGRRAAAERLIDGRARLLYQPKMTSLADYLEFVKEAEAPLAALALSSADAADRMADRAEAYALARFAPSLAPSIAAEACESARRLLGASAAAAQPSGVIGQVAFLSLAKGYASRPDGRAWPAGKRLALLKCVLTGRL